MAEQFLLFISRETTRAGNTFSSLLPSTLSLSFLLLKPTVAVEFKCAAAKGIQYSFVFLQGGAACSITLCQSGSDIVKWQGRREMSLVQKGLLALAQSPEFNSNDIKLISMGGITF